MASVSQLCWRGLTRRLTLPPGFGIAIPFGHVNFVFAGVIIEPRTSSFDAGLNPIGLGHVILGWTSEPDPSTLLTLRGYKDRAGHARGARPRTRGPDSVIVRYR